MSTMSGGTRLGARLGALVAAAVTVAACSTGASSTSPTSLPVITIDSLDPTTTTTIPEVGTTEATTTTAPPTTVASTTTLEATTTTTEPLAVQELVLRGDGIGAARFGAEPEGVIGYVTSILGGNTGDTGWVDPFTFADCGAGGLATVARRVDWGVLSLLFSDGSSYAFERRHFIGYEYGRDGRIGDEPKGLRTQGGVTLGSRLVDLVAEFPEVSINAGDSDAAIPDNYYVSDVFRGLLTGTGAEDVVTVMFGGYGCFE